MQNPNKELLRLLGSPDDNAVYTYFSLKMQISFLQVLLMQQKVLEKVDSFCFFLILFFL